MSAKEEKTKEELPKRHTGATTVGTDVIESVFYRGQPSFLVYDGKNFKIALSYRGEGEILFPLSKGTFPYRAYNLDEESLEKIKKWNPSYQSIFDTTYKVFDTFLDIERPYKILFSVETLESYQQHKIDSLSYLFIYGDVDSGKTRVLDVFGLLSYRPLQTVDLTPANIFNYIGYREEGGVTILEDEAQSLRQDLHPEKMAIFKSGYRKGAKVPRIVDPSTERKQRFYNTFCSKVFAGEWMPRNRAFRQRCIQVPMIWGKPVKDKIEEEDRERTDMIKLGLLVWRMRNYWKLFPNIETNLYGRMRELWESKIQILHGLNVEEEFKGMVEESKKDKLRTLSQSLESFVTRAVIRCYKQAERKELPFSHIWRQLCVELGVEWDNQEKIKSSYLQYDVTKAKVGGMLRSILNGSSDFRFDVGRVWSFQKDRLEKLTEKYGLEEEYLFT